jgi:hypothetical protein
MNFITLVRIVGYSDHRGEQMEPIHLNPRYIISVEPFEGKRAKSEVIVRGAMTSTYWCVETHEHILQLINEALTNE